MTTDDGEPRLLLDELLKGIDPKSEEGKSILSLFLNVKTKSMSLKGWTEADLDEVERAMRLIWDCELSEAIEWVEQLRAMLEKRNSTIQ